MAPPEHTFPVTELEKQIHTHSVNLREKNRKLGSKFNLKECELYELVQYSCTTQTQQQENIRKTAGAASQIECYPFTRLFRRCGTGDKTFHVETTAWEGQHAWPRETTAKQETSQPSSAGTYTNGFANYAGFLWSKGEQN